MRTDDRQDREAPCLPDEPYGTFYKAYEAVRPLDPGAATRRDLYNLYHVLNHLNLFGGGYRAQAGAMIEQLLAQVG